MTGAASPAEVTHAFCIMDMRMLHGLLHARRAGKIVESRPVRFPVGWYAVKLGDTASTTLRDELAFREEFPDFPTPMAAKRGHVYGLVKVGYHLPQSACSGNRWASTDCAYGNIITHVLPFDDPGAAVAGTFGTFPLGKAQEATRTTAKTEVAAGRLRTTDAQTALPEQPELWDEPAPKPSGQGGRAKAAEGKGKAKAKAQVSAQPPPKAQAGARPKPAQAPLKRPTTPAAAAPIGPPRKQVAKPKRATPGPVSPSLLGGAAANRPSQPSQCSA